MYDIGKLVEEWRESGVIEYEDEVDPTGDFALRTTNRSKKAYVM